MNNKEAKNVNLKRFEKKEKKDYFDFFARRLSVDYSIDIRVDSVSELYNKYDPSPLPRRYLNDEVEAYILAQMQHAAHNTKITLNFHPVQPEEKENSQIAESCIHHFKDRAFEQYSINGGCGFGLSVYFSVCSFIDLSCRCTHLEADSRRSVVCNLERRIRYYRLGCSLGTGKLFAIRQAARQP